MWLPTVCLMMTVLGLGLQGLAEGLNVRRERSPPVTTTTVSPSFEPTQPITPHRVDGEEIPTKASSVLFVGSNEARLMELTRIATAKKLWHWRNLLNELQKIDEEEEEEILRVKRGAEEENEKKEDGEDVGTRRGSRRVKREAEKKSEEEADKEKKSTDEKSQEKEMATDKKEKRGGQEEKGKRNDVAEKAGASKAAAADVTEEEEKEKAEEEEEEEEEQEVEKKKKKKGKTMEAKQKKKRHYLYSDAGMDEAEDEKSEEEDREEELNVKRSDDEDVQLKEKKRATRHRGKEKEEEEEEQEEEEQVEEEEEEEEKKRAARKQRKNLKQKKRSELLSGRSQRTQYQVANKYRSRRQQSIGAEEAPMRKYRSSNDGLGRNYRGISKANNDYGRRTYRDQSDEGNYRQRRHDDNENRFWREAANEDRRNNAEDIKLLRSIRSPEDTEVEEMRSAASARSADVNAAVNADNYDTVRNLRNAVYYGRIGRSSKDERSDRDTEAAAAAADNYDTVRNVRNPIYYGRIGRSSEDERLARDLEDDERRKEYEYRGMRHALGDDRGADVSAEEEEEYRAMRSAADDSFKNQRSDARRTRLADYESPEYEERRMREAEDESGARVSDRLRRLRYAGAEDKAAEVEEERLRRLAYEEDYADRRKKFVDADGFEIENDVTKRRPSRRVEKEEQESRKTGEAEEEKELEQRGVRFSDVGDEDRMAEYDARKIIRSDDSGVVGNERKLRKAADEKDEGMTMEEFRKLRRTDDSVDKTRRVRYTGDDRRRMEKDRERRKRRNADDDADKKTELRSRKLSDDVSKRSDESKTDESDSRLSDADSADEDRSRVMRSLKNTQMDEDLPQEKSSTKDEQTMVRKKARSRRGSSAYGLLIAGLVPRLVKLRQQLISIDDKTRPVNTSVTVGLETGKTSSGSVLPDAKAKDGTAVEVKQSDEMGNLVPDQQKTPKDKDKGKNTNETESETSSSNAGDADNQTAVKTKVHYSQSQLNAASEDEGRRLKDMLKERRMPVKNDPHKKLRIQSASKPCPKGDCSAVQPAKRSTSVQPVLSDPTN